MKVTNEGRNIVGGIWSSLGGDPSLEEGETPIDCCDPGVPPPDRAEDAAVFTVSDPPVGGIVQTKSGPWISSSGPHEESFDTTPTNGSTLYAFIFVPSGITVTSSGWTLLESGSASGGVDVWTKVAGAAEPTLVEATGGGVNARRFVLYEVAGTVDVHDDVDSAGIGSPLTGPTLTPSDEPGVLIWAVSGQVAIYAGDPTWTPLGGLVTDSFSRENSPVPKGRNVTWTGHVDTALAAVTPTMTTTTLYGGTTTGSVAVVTLTADPTDAEWNVPAPNTVDGDDATYQEIDGTAVLRIDLGGAFRIVKSRLLVGSEDAGSRTYTIIGGNEADLSDGVTLGVLSFDATGSFTPDDLTIEWMTAESYRYFELDGSDENRRVFTWELYEPDTSLGQDHNHDAIEAEIDDIADGLNNHVADTTDAHEASAVTYDPTASGLTATDVQAAIDEVQAEIDGFSSSTGVGELLIVDTGASTPLIFADIVQNEAQDDLVYADL